MATKKDEQASKIEVKFFDIKWPEQLEKVKPIFTVQYTNTRVAEVYETEIAVRRPARDDDYTYENQERYGIISRIIKSGKMLDTDRYHSSAAIKYFNTLLEVKAYIEAQSQLSVPTTKTIKQRVHVDPDAEDYEE